MKRVFSWGRAHPCKAEVLSYHEGMAFRHSQSYLPVGLLRSYGDSCLNDRNTLVDMTSLRRILSLDETSGILEVEAGISLDALLKAIVPRGFFFPVTPGTKFVTVGGAIANDVHGKNHHQAGTLGCFVESFRLLRTDGSIWDCSPTENQGLFEATIGGLGLTGFLLSARIRLIRIPSSYWRVSLRRFEGLDEYLALSEEYREREYTVSWLDCLARGENRSRARGIFIAGETTDDPRGFSIHRKAFLNVPFELPSLSLNPYSMRAFNHLYFVRVPRKGRQLVQHYDPFFYPLDSVENWNRIYGRRGFHQYQCVVPKEAVSALQQILDEVALSNQGSFLSVLKTFGSKRSPGLLSFPMEGYTLCLDFPFLGPETLQLLQTLDEIVFECGGRLYPAKDGRMQASQFQKSFPNWERFLAFCDAGISSDFARRTLDTLRPSLPRKSEKKGPEWEGEVPKASNSI